MRAPRDARPRAARGAAAHRPSPADSARAHDIAQHRFASCVRGTLACRSRIGVAASKVVTVVATVDRRDIVPMRIRARTTV
ncbi:hypothetical protein BBJ41_21065 [Burkholderia stabilis]|nr:hypothetical protein BBJ41_21065 [Burkholderia stabilis]